MRVCVPRSQSVCWFSWRDSSLSPARRRLPPLSDVQLQQSIGRDIHTYRRLYRRYIYRYHLYGFGAYCVSGKKDELMGIPVANLSRALSQSRHFVAFWLLDPFSYSPPLPVWLMIFYWCAYEPSSFGPGELFFPFFFSYCFAPRYHYYDYFQKSRTDWDWRMDVEAPNLTTWSPSSLSTTIRLSCSFFFSPWKNKMPGPTPAPAAYKIFLL